MSNASFPDDSEPQAFTDYSQDGVDLTLIRSMLSKTPAERLEFLESQRPSAR